MSPRHGMGFAARAFGEDDDNVALFQLLVGGPQGLAISFAAFDRKGTHETYQPAYPALKGLFLCHLEYGAREVGREEWILEPRKMVRGDNEGSFRGYIFEPAQAHTGNNGKDNLSKHPDGSPEKGRHFVGLVEILLWFH